MVGFKAKVVLAGTPFPPATLLKSMEAANRRIADQIRRDFEATVRTWEKKPTFRVLRVKKGDAIHYDVFTESAIYGYVDKGTKPHDIYPKATNPTGRLWFRAPYRAKTTPNLLSSKAGGLAKNAKLYTAEMVHHPGTEARNFVKIIKERFASKVVFENNRLLREWLAKKTAPKERV